MGAMNKQTPVISPLWRKFQNIRRKLGRTGYISQGSVQDRTDRRGGGAGYQWTRKVGKKTITVSLTAPQFREMKQAIAAQRRLRRNIAELEKISRTIIFQSNPHPTRRKRLSRKVLGLI